MKNLHSTTKLAIQVVVALIVTWILTTVAHLPRPYWGYITVVSVLCQTWGESLRKSSQRLLATVAGLTLGVVIDIPLQHVIPVEIAIIIICLFLMSYYSTVSYPRSIFFMSILLTMIFASTGKLSHEIYWARIIETLAGTGIAILTGMFVLPTHPKDELRAALKDYLQTAQKAYAETLNLLIEPQDDSPPKTSYHLQRDFNQLKTKSDTYFREASLRRAPAVEAKTLFRIMQSISFYHTNLKHTAMGNRNNPLCQRFREDLIEANRIIQHDLQQIIAHIENDQPVHMLSFDKLRTSIDGKITHLLAQGDCNRPQLLDILPIFYFVRKACARCSRLEADNTSPESARYSSKTAHSL